MQDASERQIKAGDEETSITLTAKADGLYYHIRDSDNEAKFSVSWDVFNLLRAAEEKVVRRNEAPTISPPLGILDSARP